MARTTFRIWRGDGAGGQLADYSTEVSEGMVVLDAVHQIQAESAPDLAARWNCKAGKCGSCSAEVNGRPRLMCMTRLSDLPPDEPVTIEPMQAFPAIRDLVTDVSSNYRSKARIQKFQPRPPDAADGTWRMSQADVDRVQEFRKCIECFLCQDVCHVLRDHHLHEEFIGPRLLVHAAALEMHPLDTADRLADLKQRDGIGYCNITKCCTTVCPEGITITDNAIIPLKERVVDEYFDPLRKLFPHLPSLNVAAMQFEFKPLSREAVPAALEKAARYRLLNEPMEAESICQDVLAVDPDNREALSTLFLALTDQLEGAHGRFEEARSLLVRFADDYSRHYYHGILCERRAKALWHRGDPRTTAVTHAGLCDAMAHYEAAAEKRPAGNDDALLRWNTCARLLTAHPELCEEPATAGGQHWLE